MVALFRCRGQWPDEQATAPIFPSCRLEAGEELRSRWIRECNRGAKLEIGQEVGGWIKNRIVLDRIRQQRRDAAVGRGIAMRLDLLGIHGRSLQIIDEGVSCILV